MTELLHITEASTWRQAQAEGRFTMSTKGVTLAEEGYVHTALRRQLRAVAERLYADASVALVVLVVDGDLVGAPVRFEAFVEGGEEYPHIYGPIPLGAVVEVVPVTWDVDGRMVLPE